MFGPLPRLHRLLLIAVVLALTVASGAWIAYFTPLPMATTAGAVLGAVGGIGLCFWMLHQQVQHPGSRLRRH